MYKILAVEDSASNRDLIKRFLMRNEFSVVLAKDGYEAIKVAKEEMPDLILMDLGLPELNGWDATQKLKADKETSHIPIIALTAHAMTRDRTKALESGCDDIELKPFDFNSLLKKMSKLLESNN